MAIIISAAVFIAVVTAVTLFGYRRYVLAGRVYENLESPAGNTFGQGEANAESFTISRAAEFIGVRLPPSAASTSGYQLKLLAAGYREPNAVATFYGLKLMLMAATAVVFALPLLNSRVAIFIRIALIAFGVFLAFRIPDYVLAARITKRQKLLKKALPDALDLFVICAEAGLTIDRCFRNVTQQLAIVHRELCQEFSVFTAEISAGLRRKEALENLAGRTQEKEIRKFVSVLTQADRFGTSMADALRTHAEYLRIRRRQDAEEKASQVAVKLIFPIFFFIMPCMLLVTVGPAAIAIAKQLGGLFGGK